ncbi:hypothetical protein LSAT2_028544 [Lamellibrachia satsuma]|nr:hypothetical protein LSAT2_028544 [Lamellibrachia satsuma]
MSQPARIHRPEGGHRLAALGKRLPTTARLPATHAAPALAGASVMRSVNGSTEFDVNTAVAATLKYAPERSGGDIMLRVAILFLSLPKDESEKKCRLILRDVVNSALYVSSPPCGATYYASK